jgi:hypothetical protein
VDEKNHQVEMMDIIYGNAERVCIWLGEENDSSRTALRFIKEELSQLQSFDILCDTENAGKNWLALLELMQRPWFSRRWVVQELALAQKPLIYCGQSKISWKKFAIAVELFVEIETATHRLSEVMEKDQQYQYVPSYFEFVSALGASLLVDATERLFRDYKEVKILKPAVVYPSKSSDHSDSETCSADSDGEDSDASTLSGPNSPRDSQKSRIQPLLSLEYLVSNLTIFETTVPHDTIYALLAIAKDTSPRAVAPGAVLSARGAQEGLESYTLRKSYIVNYNLPYVDVCKDFILFSIERSLQGNQSRALDVICRPWAIEERKLRIIRDQKREKKKEVARATARDAKRRKKRESKKHRELPKESTSLPSDDLAEKEDMPLPSWVPQLSGAPYAMTRKPGSHGLRMSRINADPLVGLPSPSPSNYSAAETKGVDVQALRFRKRLMMGLPPPCHPPQPDPTMRTFHLPEPPLSHFSLYVRGFELDVIEKVEQVARNGQIPREWADLGGWHGAHGQPPDGFWRTLVANRGKDGKNPPVYYSRACEESFKKGGLESGAVDTTSLIDFERNSVVAQFCRRVQAVTWNRALVKTKGHRLGMVGQLVQTNDVVCILYGCSVPVILRRSDRKRAEIMDMEIDQEMRDIKWTILRSLMNYMSRKRRHEVRKDLRMAQLLKSWLDLPKAVYVAGTRDGNWTEEQKKLKEEKNAQVYRAVIRTTRHLWLQRLKQRNSDLWQEQLQEMTSARTTERDIDEQIKEQVRSRQKALLQQRVGRSSGANHQLSEDSLTVLARKKPGFDWWEFQHALAAGRKWKRFVVENKKNRAAFKMKDTDLGWAKLRLETFEVFKRRRKESGMWEETEKCLAEPETSSTKDSKKEVAKKNPRELTISESVKYEEDIRAKLRRTLGEEGSYSYKFLGECYIHGAMDGEAMVFQNAGDKGDFPSKVFEIR